MENHHCVHLCGELSKTEISVQEVIFDSEFFNAEIPTTVKTKTV